MNVKEFVEYLKEEFAPDVNNDFVWDTITGFITDILTQYDKETAIDVIYTCVPHISKHVIIEFFYI
jgi:NAD(P)H-flavin reductase